MGVIREEHIVEVTVILNGLILRGEESTGDMYASIDMVVDKLEKQLVKYKTRLRRSLRQKGLRALGEKLAAPEAREKETEEDRVVKTKRFPLKPMHLEEAIMQMNLLGHDFFVFANAERDCECSLSAKTRLRPHRAGIRTLKKSALCKQTSCSDLERFIADGRRRQCGHF